MRIHYATSPLNGKVLIGNAKKILKVKLARCSTDAAQNSFSVFVQNFAYGFSRHFQSLGHIA